jgi:hypothetical protein
MAEDILKLENKLKNLETEFEDFSYSISKKLGNSGAREVVTQIANGSKLVIGQTDAVFKADQNGIYLGNAVFASAPFRVSMAGALTATSATITGSVIATGGAFGGWVLTATTFYNLVSGTPTASPSDGLVFDATNQVITAYENTEKRIEVGKLSSGIFGVKTYDDNGTTILLEVSDTQKVVAGWTISSTTLANSTNIILDASNKAISINDATFGNQGIQAQYNSGTPRFYCGDGADQHLNFDGTNTTVNNSTLDFQNVFGDGADGSLTTSGDVALTSDTYYTDLTISTNDKVDTAGYRLFVNGTLTINSGGVVERTPNAGGNGGNATLNHTIGAAGSAAGALADGSVKGALAGEVGIAGTLGVSYTTTGAGSTNGTAGTNGTNGTNITKSLASADGVAGTNGAVGGNASVSPISGTGGAASTGGTAGTRTSTPKNEIRSETAAYMLFDTIDGTQMQAAPSNGNGGTPGIGAVAKGPSGSEVGSVYSGASGGTGGGGSQGGICTVFARKIIINSGGTMRANGGDGGAGGNSGDSRTSGTTGGLSYAGAGTPGAVGGSAGNGGILIYVYSSLTNNGTIEAVAGTVGAGGSAGTKVEETGASGTPVANQGASGAAGATGIAGVSIPIKV